MFSNNEKFYTLFSKTNIQQLTCAQQPEFYYQQRYDFSRQHTRSPTQRLPKIFPRWEVGGENKELFLVLSTFKDN
jgi:hypothetical protein